MDNLEKILPPQLLNQLTAKSKITLSNYLERMTQDEANITFDDQSGYFVFENDQSKTFFDIEVKGDSVIIDEVRGKIGGIDPKLNILDIKGPESARSLKGEIIDEKLGDVQLFNVDQRFAEGGIKRMFIDVHNGSAWEFGSSSDLTKFVGSAGISGVKGEVKLAELTSGFKYYSEPSTELDLDSINGGYKVKVTQKVKGLDLSAGAGAEGGISVDFRNKSLWEIIEKPKLTLGLGIDPTLFEKNDLTNNYYSLSHFDRDHLFIEGAENRIARLTSEIETKLIMVFPSEQDKLLHRENVNFFEKEKDWLKQYKGEIQDRLVEFQDNPAQYKREANINLESLKISDSSGSASPLFTGDIQIKNTDDNMGAPREALSEPGNIGNPSASPDPSAEETLAGIFQHQAASDNTSEDRIPLDPVSFSIEEILAAGYTVTECHEAGVSSEAMYDASVHSSEMKNGGYLAEEMYSVYDGLK